MYIDDIQIYIAVHADLGLQKQQLNTPFCSSSLNTEVDASNTLVRATSMNGKVTASTSQDCFSDIHYLFIVEDLASRILSIISS
jgi:hypothetical protein